MPLIVFTVSPFWIGPITLLDDLIDDACASRSGQLTQFIQGVMADQYCVFHESGSFSYECSVVVAAACGSGAGGGGGGTEAILAVVTVEIACLKINCS